MKKVLLILFTGILLYSCDTRQDVYDTGISDPCFEGTMMDYLRSDDYNWKLTVEMIERAGLTDLFEGKVDTLPEITFWGFKSYSVLLYLLENDLESVDELTPSECRESVLKHVTKGKHLKDSFAFRDVNFDINDARQTGVVEYATLGKNKLKPYREKTAYAGVPDAGAVIMYLFSTTYNWGEGIMVPMATPDIQPYNGVVHALNYNYRLGEI